MPHRVRRASRRAGVLLPLCMVGDTPSVLFTVRADTLKSHSGEVSFPGGMMDAGDADITATALRECCEEIGHVNIEVMCLSDDVPNKDQSICVTPVVAWLGDPL